MRIGGVAQWGDGFLGTVVDPVTADQIICQAPSAWQAAGRTGAPRCVMGLYAALGPGAAERGANDVHESYAFDPAMTPLIAGSVLATPGAFADALRAYGDVGIDELDFWPTGGDIDQVRRRADAVG